MATSNDKQAREARLAAQLRSNLSKRKAQLRARNQHGVDDAPDGPDSPDPVAPVPGTESENG